MFPPYVYLPWEEGFENTLLCFTSPFTSQSSQLCSGNSGAVASKGRWEWFSCSGLDLLQNNRSNALTSLVLSTTMLNTEGLRRRPFGSGRDTYEKGKNALQSWRHFGLSWAFVDSKTQVQNGVKFCACVKEFLPWLVMPLEVVFVNESQKSKKGVASFRFGGGTLKGHLLAGEESFSIELDKNNQVWYEILSFSKPAHFLSFIGYPYVQLRQKHFAHQSSNAVLKHLKAS
ncbi:hypothetical protein NL676_006457 [Syzygium grande]|nr:hypothetical protein NL676_006457 [Syzygium grande]